MCVVKTASRCSNSFEEIHTSYYTVSCFSFTSFSLPVLRDQSAAQELVSVETYTGAARGEADRESRASADDACEGGVMWDEATTRGRGGYVSQAFRGHTHMPARRGGWTQ